MTTDAGSEQTVHDPACHMDIAAATAAGRSDYEEKSYYFCSPGCKRDFDADPAGVLKAEAEYDHSQPLPEMAMSSPGPTTINQSSSTPSKKPWWRFW